MKKDILKDLLAKPGKKQLVSDFDSSFTGDLSKQDAKEQLAKDIEKLSELQSMLYAQDRYSFATPTNTPYKSRNRVLYQ